MRMFLYMVMVLWVSSTPMYSQYFGKNKPKYHKISFDRYQTPHFDMYHYLNNSLYLNRLAQWSEDWYRSHQLILKDTFTTHNPILFYNDHSDFQQTNAISGQVGIGTGGVTEGFKNRVIMPLAYSEQQTHHVLGHELVHAFQYHMVLGHDSMSIQNLANLPLYMVEGLAEYMSKGRHDAHTSMWLRDAVLQDDIPTIKEMRNPRYFPYRYGQAFWAVLSGLYGDHIIRPLFMNTALLGQEQAIRTTLGITQDQLNGLWQEAIRSHYQPMVQGLSPDEPGQTLIQETNAGRQNVSPVVSPNGRSLLFLSEKNVLSYDLYIADTRKGEIQERLTSTVRDDHLDQISFIESSGTWSPDSRSIAFVGFAKGRNRLVIREAESGKTEEDFNLEGLYAFTSPSWSPDRRYLVVTGMKEGQTDLYLVNLRTKSVRQMTNDRAAELMPQWVDDSTIVYTTDALSLEKGRIEGKHTFSLAYYHLATDRKENVDLFFGANNMNPYPDERGRIWFLSDRDGFRNMYMYEPSSEEVYQMTALPTGISGITPFSPALSVARNADRILYSVYQDRGYHIIRASANDFLWQKVDKEYVDQNASLLPVVSGSDAPQLVRNQLQRIDDMADVSVDSMEKKPFRPRFRLDYAGGGAGGGVGLGANSIGAGLAGGVDLLFSDITGNHQLYSSLSLNGEVFDVGGVFQYLNRARRLAWGLSYSHIPFRTGGQFSTRDTLPGSNIEVPVIQTDIFRIFQDQVGAFLQYPFSVSQRLEGGVSVAYNYFRYDQYKNYYDQFGRFLGRDRNRVDLPKEVSINGIRYATGFLYSLNAAYVGDNSRFGLTSPLDGYRFRIGGEIYRGLFSYETIVMDLRRYFYTNPVSFGFRVMHYGRLGEDANNFFPIYLGQQGLVRGLQINDANEFFQRYNINLNELTGSKFLLAGAEVRLPFTGPQRLALVPSNFLLTQLALFLDGGVTFQSYEQIIGEEQQWGELQPIATAGVSLRVNVFNALIVEPYLAWPLRKNSRAVFGVQFLPGW